MNRRHLIVVAVIGITLVNVFGLPSLPASPETPGPDTAEYVDHGINIYEASPGDHDAKIWATARNTGNETLLLRITITPIVEGEAMLDAQDGVVEVSPGGVGRVSERWASWSNEEKYIEGARVEVEACRGSMPIRRTCTEVLDTNDW